MKKQSFKLLVLAVLIGLISCDGDTDPKKTSADSTAVVKDSTAMADSSKPKKVNFEDECTNLDGLDNMIVDTKDAQKMRDEFKTSFMKVATTGKHLADSVWIAADVFIDFAYHLYYHKECDGVNFVQGVKKADDETKLIMVPTTPNGDKHLNNWSNINSHSSGPASEYREYGLGETTTINRVNLFDQLYRGSFDCSKKVICLSKSVWVSRCVFEVLKYMIEDTNNEIDGIVVYNAAYSDSSLGSKFGQTANKQSTIVMVPTHLAKDGVTHNVDWNLIPDKVKEIGKGNIKVKRIVKKIEYNLILDKAVKVNFVAGLNHGQLCPQICEQ